MRCSGQRWNLSFVCSHMAISCCVLLLYFGPGSSVGIVTELRAGRSGIESHWKIRHFSGEGQGGCIVSFCLVSNRGQHDSTSDSCKSGSFCMQTFCTAEGRYYSFDRCFCTGTSKNISCRESNPWSLDYIWCQNLPCMGSNTLVRLLRA